MNPKQTIAFFGSSLVSTYFNGAATYYRGILQSLHYLGFSITFYEPDILQRQENRDIDDPPYARVVVYQPTPEELDKCLKEAMEADFLIKGSDVGLFDEKIEIFILTQKRSGQQVFYWDVDAPATLARIHENNLDYFKLLIPYFDHILTYGGGEKVKDLYSSLGAEKVSLVYTAFSPETHFPVKSNPEHGADLAFMGNRLPDREKRVDEFFFKVANALPNHKFILGGSGWNDKPMPSNVAYLGHVSSQEHNAFNCSSRVILNICRNSKAECGYSPGTRIFEAAGAAACIITDAWLGVSSFFDPEKEILVVANAEQLIGILKSLSKENARKIGKAAYLKALSTHTYQHRVKDLQEIFSKNKVVSIPKNSN